MKITLSSVIVNDQARALRFYTEVLGFVVKKDIPLGEHRWLTVASPEGVAGVELLLEPDAHPGGQGVPEGAPSGRDPGDVVRVGGHPAGA